jgi:Putative peptidoglycan binding domain
MPSPAPCCRQALRDATIAWPNRNRAWDGIMGDARHQQRPSDHNQGNAFDLTHDPANGVDCGVLSRQVINDARVTYVIYNHQIYNRARAAEGWRVYTGANPHTHHMHVSIRDDSRDNLAPWPWSNAAPAPAPPGRTHTTAYPGTRIQVGSSGPSVGLIQERLNVHGFGLTVDQNFGQRTRSAVVLFQTRFHLLPDGVVGPITWNALIQQPAALFQSARR